MKKIGLVLLALLMVLSAAACSPGTAPTPSPAPAGDASPTGDASPAGDGQRTYFVNPKMVGAAYWEYAKEGALRAGEALGAEVIWNGTPNVDAAAQVNMITDMINRKVDGMAIAVNDATSVSNVFQQAKDAGIPIVTFDSDSSEGAGRTYFVTPDTDAAIGEAFLECLMEQMPEKKGKIAIMIASASAGNMIAWQEGALAKIKSDYPDLEIIGTYASDDDQQKAYENAKQFIQATPDLKGILCLAAAETPAACQAVQEAVAAGQLQAGQVKIGGMGIPSMVKDYLKDGTMTTSVMWNPSDLGFLATWAVHQVVTGGEIKDGQVVEGVTNPIKVDGNTIYAGTFKFNAETVDNYPF